MYIDLFYWIIWNLLVNENEVYLLVWKYGLLKCGIENLNGKWNEMKNGKFYLLLFIW